jgi:hypothetical protein
MKARATAGEANASVAVAASMAASLHRDGRAMAAVVFAVLDVPSVSISAALRWAGARTYPTTPPGNAQPQTNARALPRRGREQGFSNARPVSVSALTSRPWLSASNASAPAKPSSAAHWSSISSARPGTIALLDDPTPREHEALALVARGRDDRGIAQAHAPEGGSCGEERGGCAGRDPPRQPLCDTG